MDRVYLNYGAAGQEGLHNISLTEMKRYYAEGHFPAGSMGPKIEAAIEFLEAGGREVVITRPELMKAALAGRAGTRISV